MVVALVGIGILYGIVSEYRSCEARGGVPKVVWEQTICFAPEALK